MSAATETDRAAGKRATTVERTSERELVVRRAFNAPARLVFEAWTTPALFKQWWAPKSFGVTMLSCEMDVRVGGGYRLVFAHPAAGEGGAVTTVTFEERGGETLVVMRDLYPSKEALDEAVASQSTSGFGETF